MTDFMVMNASASEECYVLHGVFENIENEYIYHDCIIKQMDKGQDFCKIGKGKDSFGDESEFDYIIVMDGHGDSHVYSSFYEPILNSMDFSVLLGTENPVQSIANFIETKNHITILFEGTLAALRIGSTLAIAKIYHNSEKIKIVCYNVGDSRIGIFQNDRQIYINTPHNIGSESERERLEIKLRERTAVINEEYNFKLVNNNTICKYQSNRVVFYYGSYLFTSLVPTQCMGHLGITGLKPEVYVAEFDANQKIRVVVYSDGVDDMLCDGLHEDETLMASKSCNEIMEKIMERWSTRWTIENVFYKDPTNPDAPLVNQTILFQKGDDCSIAIWDNYSLV
jgi:serine/threonine protein phosphatase PrpC